ncbi:cilia- and flagella-associated protein 300 [Esox lucius]|uniref:Cilia- and flagella-associated protein 300 n=1 Tax=Esox lucius TaxID=8010 RepID=A0A3P8YRZ3_ESOLU|nr:cilia- and flagella-associated protein 300 [Esox lucius]
MVTNKHKPLHVMATVKSAFSFNLLPRKNFYFLQDKCTLQLLMKWSMLGRLSAQAYSFDQTFFPYNCHDFTLSFFRDPCVLANLRKIEAGAWVQMNSEVVCVESEVVPCTKVSMEMFDPLFSSGIIRPSGHIVKCLHNTHSDYDLLRQMLQEEDSEEYRVIELGERREFLFCLFKHLTLGGELCQYEDTISPYLETTRTIYRDLVSVQKDPETKQISVVSTVINVSALDASGVCYPSRDREDQTFCYLIVDPFRRHVCVFYHCYGVGSFTL